MKNTVVKLWGLDYSVTWYFGLKWATVPAHDMK